MIGEGLHARVLGRLGRLVIDVEFATTGTLVIVGPNGAGKSSLLGMLLGVVKTERGQVTVGGKVLKDTTLGIDVPVEQRKLGYVPQDYALFPHLNVEENVAFAFASMRRSRAERTQKLLALLSELGLTAHRARRIQNLSGGEQQRVALARALSVEPRALLLDEPLAALDVHSRREVRASLATHLARVALPTIVVTHDAADARKLGDRIAVLEAGRITQTGRWDELVAAPASRFVKEFVSSND